MSNQLGNAAIAVALLMVGTTALAQTPPARAPATPAQREIVPQRIDPKACAEQLQVPPGGGSPTTQGQRVPNQTLSDKLDRTEGVICPPLGLDPELVERPPAGGITPVIPPPGSPGGDPTVRPK